MGFRNEVNDEQAELASDHDKKLIEKLSQELAELRQFLTIEQDNYKHQQKLISALKQTLEFYAYESWELSLELEECNNHMSYYKPDIGKSSILVKDKGKKAREALSKHFKNSLSKCDFCPEACGQPWCGVAELGQEF